MTKAKAIKKTKQKEIEQEDPEPIVEIKIPKGTLFDGKCCACPSCKEVVLFCSTNKWLCPKCGYDFMG